jgi:single stranded DNA-binding protein
MNVNKLIIVGRIGRDPEMKEVGNGLCTFSVAVSERYKDREGEWQEKTDWFTVNIWGEHGKRMMGKLHKGMLVYVEGKYNSRKHEDKVYWTLTPDFGGLTILEKRSDKGNDQPAASVADDGLPF